ncbi:class II aldolase/adducin family protein [Clostridiaceae bacterium M8S5]|nr:class II aldolase/adducin family protein [Clostridiaceae bacterium M8S5]
MDINEAKNLVIKAGIKLVDTGLIARTWGNVSCRVDNNSFVITPSGMNYNSLKPEDIVHVNIDDLSYSGDIKPSSEKGIHAGVYKQRPSANFVIHTHQTYASVISATHLESMKINGNYKNLKNKILCAKYALPGTKSLCKNVLEALKNTKENAIIMKYHGALCFAEDYEKTFETILELEKACEEYIINHYLNLSHSSKYNPAQMASYVLLNKIGNKPFDENGKKYYNSNRTNQGFELYRDDENDVIPNNALNLSTHTKEKIKKHKIIYETNKHINHILFDDSPEVKVLAQSGFSLKPLLDDFAQIAGVHVKNTEDDAYKIAKCLKKSPVVFIKNVGAIYTGSSFDEADAVRLVTKKAIKTLVGAKLLGEVKYINKFESMLMRFVYKKKYSKKIKRGKK